MRRTLALVAAGVVVAAGACSDGGPSPTAVTEVVAYRTMAIDPEREGEPDVYRMLLDRRIDVVTFTSPSAVRNFVRVVGAEPAADLLNCPAREPGTMPAS